MVTPSSSARGSFEPGFSPTITKLVFFDTLPVILPPRAIDRRRGLVAREPLEPAGEDERAAGEGLLLGRTFGRRRTGEVDPRGAQLLDQRRGWSGP